MLMVPKEAVGAWRLLKRDFKFTLEALTVGIVLRKKKHVLKMVWGKQNTETASQCHHSP